MADGNQRLDVVLLKLLENRTIEVETRLIRLLLDALGEDATPGDGHAEHLEAHLGKEGDVLLIAMIEVDAVVVGIQLVGVNLERDLARLLVAAAHEVVVD